MDDERVRSESHEPTRLHEVSHSPGNPLLLGKKVITAHRCGQRRFHGSWTMKDSINRRKCNGRLVVIWPSSDYLRGPRRPTASLISSAWHLMGVAGGTGSASPRRLATAACSARALCLLRTFSTAFVQAAVFAAPALSLRSICLLRSVSTAFSQTLGAAKRPFQSLSVGVVITGK
jgi:hypothetical protein